MPINPFSVPTARSGTSVRQAFIDLAAEEAAHTMQRHGSMRMAQSPHGTTLVKDGAVSVWLHPWRATLSAGGVLYMRPGRVNLLMPTVLGTRMDAPGFTFSLAGVVPNTELESYVCVQVRRDPATGKIMDVEKDKNPVTLIHTAALDTLHRDGGSLALNHLGREPLAVITWSNTSAPSRVEQVADGDFHWDFLPAAKGARGRHFFT